MTVLVLNTVCGCKCKDPQLTRAANLEEENIHRHDGNSLETDSSVTKDDDILYLRWSDFHIPLHVLKQGSGEREGRARGLISVF